jgi:hypothetical protein
MGKSTRKMIQMHKNSPPWFEKSCKLLKRARKERTARLGIKHIPEIVTVCERLKWTIGHINRTELYRTIIASGRREERILTMQILHP